MSMLPNTQLPDEYYGSDRSELNGFIPDTLTRVLDVGCAEGGFLCMLAKSRPGLETWGIEPTEIAAMKAKQRLTHLIWGGVENSLASLPDAYFDCITFNDVLEHLVDPWAVLRTIHAKLAPGGVIVASIPNVRQFGVIKELLQEADFKYKDFGILDRTHLRFFTKKSMVRLFNDCDYAVYRIEGIWAKPLPLKMALINRFLGGAWEDMRYQQFVVCARSN